MFMYISYFNILKIYPPPCLPKQNIDINFNRSSYKSTFSVLIIFDRTFEKNMMAAWHTTKHLT